MRPHPPTRRREDWPERLAAFVEARRMSPFAWGTNDCITLAGDLLLDIAEVDISPDTRGAYTSETEADALLAERGGVEGILRSAAERLGLPECPLSFAQRGDLCLLLIGNQPTTGIWLGDRAVAPGLDGLVFAPARTVQTVWAV